MQCSDDITQDNTKLVLVNGHKRLAEYRGLDSNGVPIWLLVSNAPKQRRAKHMVPYKGNHFLGYLPLGPQPNPYRRVDGCTRTVIAVTENSVLGALSSKAQRTRS